MNRLGTITELFLKHSSRQDAFTNAIQTMTLALVKKYVAGESIDPVTLVMLYKSTPITQAGVSR